MAKSKGASNRARDDREELAKRTAERGSAVAAYKDILNRRENELLALSEETGPLSETFKDAKNELQRAEGQHTQIHSAIRYRPLNKLHIRFRFFAAFALALALLEAPVNKYLFDVALQGSNIVSYSISIAVACFLLALAHLAGKCLRQIWSEHRKKLIWSNLLIFLASSAVVITVICILTVGRASTAADAALGGFNDIFSAVTSTIGAMGIWGTLSTAFSNIPALILATVNLGGVFVALLLAFFSHDPDKDFDLAANALERARDSVKRLQATYLKKRKKIIRSYEPDLAGISGRHGSANGHVTELKTRLGIPLDDEDRQVIDELDRLAEDSEHAEEAGVIEQTEPSAGTLHFPRRDSPSSRVSGASASSA